MHISCTIDAHEGCDVSVMDIPGGFLWEDDDKLFLMLLQGEQAEIMIKVDNHLQKMCLQWK